MKKTLLFTFIILSISSCVVFISKPEKEQEKNNQNSADTFGLLPQISSPTEYATIRPDQQPLQDYPTAENFEFYSQKGGTPLRRANADSIGKMFRPDIAALDTTDLNRFILHSDSAFYKNFYGDSLYIGWTGYAGGLNIYNSNGTISGSTDRRVVVDTAALLHFAYDSLSDGGIKVFGPNDDGFGVSISSENELYYISVYNDLFEAGGSTSNFGDINETNNGLGVEFLSDNFTLGDIFSENNFGYYAATDGRTVQMFSQNNGGGAEFVTSGRMTVDSNMSVLSLSAEQLAADNEIGFKWSFGPGLWAQINGIAANPGDILRTADDGLMYFYQLDTVGVNIYTSNGTIGPDDSRDVGIDSNTTLAFYYPVGVAAVEIYSGADSTAGDGYVGIKSPTENSLLIIDDTDGIYLSTDAGFFVGNGPAALTIDNASNVTIEYGDGIGGGGFLATTENGAATAKIEQNIGGTTISADDGNDLGYEISATQVTGNVQLRGFTSANASAAVSVTADDSGNGKSASVVISISDPDAAALNSAAVEIDTNGVKIQTIDGTGANGNVLKSNGLYTYWSSSSDIEWDSVGGFFSAHDQDSRRDIYQDAGEFFAYGGNGQYYYQFYGEEDSGRAQIESAENGTGKLAIVSATAEGPGSESSIVRAFIIDSLSVDVRQEITIDTNGIAILTQGSDGSAGDILQSDGSYSRWGGAGTFNADVLSFTPGGSASAWVAVPANRATLAGFATVASISPSESVTEILIDTASTTSTVNLNYTPDSRLDNPFTTVRYIYNWGSGNATVQTNQSWLFKTSATTSGTLTIASGEAYKLIWLSNATQANARFYCVKIQ